MPNMIVEFSIPGPCTGKGRPRAAKRGGYIVLYTPEKTASYESLVKMLAGKAMDGGTPIKGPVYVEITIFVQIPASFSKKKRAMAIHYDLVPQTKPDVDNVAKCVLDAMNEIVYGDDRQVCRLAIQKLYDPIPRVEVKILEV